jgi:hypothetical protein
MQDYPIWDRTHVLVHNLPHGVGVVMDMNTAMDKDKGRDTDTDMDTDTKMDMEKKIIRISDIV